MVNYHIPHSYTSLITCFFAYNKADYSIKVFIRFGSRALDVLKTAVCLYVCRDVHVLSQVHSENMHHENSLLACND